MKAICQLYMPSFYRSYGKNALREAIGVLKDLKAYGFYGVYLIAVWRGGGYDNNFDVVDYSVDPNFGSDDELKELIRKAHELNLSVGVDVIPNHVSDQHILAQNCLKGVPGYEDCLYVVSKNKAKRLTEAGVPSFFGKLAYSNFGDKYVRSTFVDYHQLNLNWHSQKVKDYFTDVFVKLRELQVDFVRVDCGMLLLEDVLRADKNNPIACINPAASIEAIREVSGGMPMFLEWFIPESAKLFEGIPNCYALDCSFVLTGVQSLSWEHEKLIPLVGGHDQKTLADRDIDAERILREMEKSEYGFIDLATLIKLKTSSEISPEDKLYDADLENPNQRYRGRGPIKPILEEFRRQLAVGTTLKWRST